MSGHPLPALRTFPAAAAPEAGRPLSICFVTFEAIGFWKNGGIGTVTTGVAELLAAAGHRVTLAFTRADMLTPEEFERAGQRYVDQGIRIVPLSRSILPPITGPLDGFTSWERYVVYEWLKGESFDVVHSSEHLGEAYYCIAAKRLGLGFADMQFWVGCHGPSAWVIEANEEIVRDRFWLWTDATERFVLAEADLVWSPSRYVLGWMAEKGYRLPAGRTFVQASRLPDDLGPLKARPRQPNAPVRELVLFGRLEPRKGVKLFLETVIALGDTLSGVRITFMGRPALIDGRPAGAFIADRLAGSGLDWTILDNLDRIEALTYITAPGRVAVMASPVDNSPCAVYELLELDASFIACAGGGIPELIDPSSHGDTLFAYTVESLSGRLRKVLEHGGPVPKSAPAVERAATEAAWTAAHRLLPTELGSKAPHPFVTARTAAAARAIVVYDGSPAALSRTVEALRGCGAAVREVVVVTSDRRSLLPHDLHPEFRRASLDALGHRRVLAELAQAGDPVLVLRSGAYVGPDGLSRLLAGIPRADAVVPFAHARREDGSVLAEPILPGGWAWSVLYGAASTGGLISAAALGILSRRGSDIPGTNPLIWFDAAVLDGLAVLPLADILLDLTGVDRGTHAAADTRARLSLCAGGLPLDQRLLFETAYGALVPPPAPAEVAAVQPETLTPAPVPTGAAPSPARAGSTVIRRVRRLLRRVSAR